MNMHCTFQTEGRKYRKVLSIMKWEILEEIPTWTLPRILHEMYIYWNIRNITEKHKFIQIFMFIWAKIKLKFKNCNNQRKPSEFYYMSNIYGNSSKHFLKRYHSYSEYLLYILSFGSNRWFRKTTKDFVFKCHDTVPERVMGRVMLSMLSKFGRRSNGESLQLPGSFLCGHTSAVDT